MRSLRGNSAKRLRGWRSPSHSYRNILRTGFEATHLRQNCQSVSTDGECRQRRPALPGG
jgi:hypothetical protein